MSLTPKTTFTGAKHVVVFISFECQSDEHNHELERNGSVDSSRGTKGGKMLTLAAQRYTAEFRMIAKVILWCI